MFLIPVSRNINLLLNFPLFAVCISSEKNRDRFLIFMFSVAFCVFGLMLQFASIVTFCGVTSTNPLVYTRCLLSRKVAIF